MIASKLSSRIALFHGPAHAIELRRVEWTADPAAAIVRLECCTLCGSDLHTITGRRVSPSPAILGHECVGRLERVPKGWRDLNGHSLRPGDRVTWSLVTSCGSCFFCKDGLPQKCDRRFKYGHERWEEDRGPTGGLADHCELRPGTSILRLPDSLDPRAATLASCAAATAWAATETAGPMTGRHVAILGAGMLGLCAAAMTRHLGAATVIVLDPDSSRLAVTGTFGATHVLSPDPRESAVCRVHDLTDGRGADVVLDMCGAVSAVSLVPELLRVGGHGVLAGSVFPGRSLELDPERLVRRNLTLSGVHNYQPSDLVQAANFLDRRQDQFPFASCVAPSFPLDNVQAAFACALRERPVRVAVTFPDA